MVKHAPAIYSYSLACCSGGGEQKSVDNCIDSAWKEIKSLSVTTNMNFLAIETFRSSVHSLPWFSQSFLYKTQALIPIVSFYTYPSPLVCSDSTTFLTPTLLPSLSFCPSISHHPSLPPFCTNPFCIIKFVPISPSINVHSIYPMNLSLKSTNQPSLLQSVEIASQT